MVEEFAGRYRLLSELGAGGSATVWLVHDRALDRPAALKLLDAPDRGSETRRERLRTEARALAALDHPRVVRVYDTGTVDDRDYLVMEYLERGSLADRLRTEGPLPPSEAVELSIQVLDGLGAAHHAGIVHRDVKPGNVLVRADGTVALCDFGIARTADGSDTRTGVALGSIGFMAPEQRVDARRAGPQADLYATACTLFNLLTGDTPVDLYLAPDSSPRWEAVPAPLREVLRRATRSEPSLRFHTAAEMAEALAAVAPAVAALPAARSVARSPLVGQVPTRVEEPSVRAEQRVRNVRPDDWGWSSRRSPVGRTAVWVGVATTALATVLFSTLGPLRTWIQPPAPASAPAAPPVPALLGSWAGSFDGYSGTLVLHGEPSALDGEITLHLGSHALRTRVKGAWIDDELVLTEVTADPITYRAHLGASGLVLEGTLLRPGAEPMPFAIVRYEGPAAEVPR